jgi:hypothetical protein
MILSAIFDNVPSDTRAPHTYAQMSRDLLGRHVERKIILPVGRN